MWHHHQASLCQILKSWGFGCYVLLVNIFKQLFLTTILVHILSTIFKKKKTGEIRKNEDGFTPFFSPLLRYVLPGRTQSPRPGHDPRPPRGVHWGGGRQSGGHTRIRSCPLTTLCPRFGWRPAALSGTVSRRAGCTAADELLKESGHLPRRIRIGHVTSTDADTELLCEYCGFSHSLYAWRCVHLQWCVCEKCVPTAAIWMNVCVCVCIQ